MCNVKLPDLDPGLVLLLDWMVKCCEVLWDKASTGGYMIL